MQNQIVTDMSNEQYHATPGLSNSRMGKLLDCPARYYAEYLDPLAPEKEKKSHFSLGSLVHTLVLEPEKFHEEHYCMPKLDKRTTKGKYEFEHHTIIAGTRNLITEEQYNTAVAMAKSVFARMPWLETKLKGASIENSLFWIDEDTGVQLKSRPDVFNADFYLDLKTTGKSCKPHIFAKSVMEYGYYRQAALAREGLFKLLGIKYKYFMNLVVEEAYPHLVSCVMMDDDMLTLGHHEFKEAARIFAECTKTNVWNDYGNKIQQIYLPSWMK